jgi:hypothetical protein
MLVSTSVKSYISATDIRYEYGQITRILQTESGGLIILFRLQFSPLARLPFWTPLSWFGEFSYPLDEFKKNVLLEAPRTKELGSVE